MIELFLVLCSSVVGYNIWRTRKIQNQLLLLEGQNKSMQEALLLPASTEAEEKEYIEHDWQCTGVETIFQGTFGTDIVKVQTDTCSRCKMVHRHITYGYPLAVSKQIHGVEGFYINGFREWDKGCKSKRKKDD